MQFNVTQKRIIKSKPNGHRLIKGVQGTGKTTTVINKIPELLKSYCVNKDDRILFVTYNEKSSKYAYNIYSNLEKEKYVQSSFFDEDKSDKFEIQTIEHLTLNYFNKYKKSTKKNLEIASLIECQNEIANAINNISKKYKKIRILNNEYMNFIQHEIDWIKSNDLKREEYLNASRKGRVVKSDSEKVITLAKNSIKRKIIYDVLEEYNNILNIKNKADLNDVTFLALKQAKKKNKRKYTHIFIDESQALTKTQLELIKAIYNEKVYSSITFILDTGETTYPKGFLTKKKAFISLGYNMKGKSNTLKQTFITCNEMDKVNYDFNSECHKADEYTTIEVNQESINFKNPYALDVIEYIDLKRNISHKFVKDSSNSNEIYIQEDGEEIKVEDLTSIPVYNEIAAGSPILINDEFEDNYYLPKLWIRQSKVFMLKIQGDSMINKNIEDGDHVIINKQNYAKNGDIVAVDIEGEATLKTYKSKEDKIMLMPENELYEPIILNENEFNIIGVAVGLLKN